MIRDRFSEVNVHNVVEQLQNIEQGVANVSNYIDRFEECMSLVKRDHPYLQEAFLMSCFIRGLRGEIKHDVSGQRPQGMLEAYWYARIYEKSAVAKRISNQGNFSRNKFTASSSNTFRSFGQKGPQAITPTGVMKPDQKTSDQERKKCYYC